MHMANELISPIVSGTMLAVTAGIGGYCIKKVDMQPIERKLPLMGTMGAFVFAAQMLNFSIPGTGASGHLCGGILLAVLLGPYAGFLTMATILLIQALFFADGGLLAYGCNVFNMGFLSCFVAYPLVFKPLKKGIQGGKKLWLAAIIGSLISLQLGAFGVVLETTLSVKTTIPFLDFLRMMQPIHLAIGLVEGCTIGAVLSFVYKTTPSLVLDTKEEVQGERKGKKRKYIWPMIWGMVILLTAGLFSHYASSNPDGLEWSILKVTGSETLEEKNPSQIHQSAESLQENTAMLPNYDFREGTSKSWLSGTSVAGIVGSALTFMIVCVIGWLGHLFRRTQESRI